MKRTVQKHARADHPRSRGVYGPDLINAMEEYGSSPLARGLLVHGDLESAQNGIIPARAGFTTRLTSTDRSGTDHPRSRGVYWSVWSETHCHAGSSPLARGLRDAQRLAACRHGIIPARAGFTSSARSTFVLRSDHPRSRGVYAAAAPNATAPIGSSPLARGLHPRRRGRLDGGRIIPARAGFTSRPWVGLAARGDHPRSRGVYHIRRWGR